MIDVVRSHLHANPAGRVRVSDIIVLVRSQIQPHQWRDCTRSKIVAALRDAGYQIGTAADHRQYLVGFSIGKPTRWIVNDGLVVLSR